MPKNHRIFFKSTIQVGFTLDSEQESGFRTKWKSDTKNREQVLNECKYNSNERKSLIYENQKKAQSYREGEQNFKEGPKITVKLKAELNRRSNSSIGSFHVSDPKNQQKLAQKHDQNKLYLGFRARIRTK